MVRSSLVQTCRPAFSSHRAPPLPPPRSLFCKTFAKIQKLYKHKNGIESTCCAFHNPYYLFSTITKGTRVFSWVIDTDVVVLHKNIIQRHKLIVPTRTYGRAQRGTRIHPYASASLPPTCSQHNAILLCHTLSCIIAVCVPGIGSKNLFTTFILDVIVFVFVVQVPALDLLKLSFIILVFSMCSFC